jgi:hypothetical protein
VILLTEVSSFPQLRPTRTNFYAGLLFRNSGIFFPPNTSELALPLQETKEKIFLFLSGLTHIEEELTSEDLETKKLEEEEVEWKKSILTQKDLDQLDKNNLSQQELKQLKKYTNIYENIDIIGKEILSLGRTDF